MTKLKTTFKRSALLSLSVFAACNVQAAGFQVGEHSASGLGRAFAGEAAIADNASVLARNPAAMTRFDNAAFSGAISGINPSIDVTDVGIDQASKDIAPAQVVPAAYYISPINDQWAWGIAMFSNYGVTTDYPTDIRPGDLAGRTSLMSVNLNPNVAYRINDQWSVGAGLNLVYATAELERRVGALPLPGKQASDKLIHMDGKSFGYGWNVGGLYEYNQDNRFGLSYRNAVDLNFDGEFTSYFPTTTSTDAELGLVLPDIVEFSGFHQLNDQWAVHYSWMRSMWSKFTELKATSNKCPAGTCFEKKEDYNDNDRFAVGTTYTLNSEWTLRAGMAFDEQAGKATLSIPDTDRYWYSAGFTYQYSKQLSMDAGFAYLHSKTATFTESNKLGQEMTFESGGAAYIGSIQVNYTFN